MPGVHAEGAIDKGRTTQSIWIKGEGYTRVGLVSSEEEKLHVRQKAGDDWQLQPYMHNCYCGRGWDTNKGIVVTIDVDMVDRQAELYVSGPNDSRLLQPEVVWTDLPEKVWVAASFKRNSAREAVLMPSSVWNVSEM